MNPFILETISKSKEFVKKFIKEANGFYPFAMINVSEKDIEYIIDDFNLRDVNLMVKRHEELALFLFNKENIISYLIIIDGKLEKVLPLYDGVVIMKLTYDGTEWFTANYYYKRVDGNILFKDS